MGNITHLRNHFKSINTLVQSYDYMIWRGKTQSSPFWVPFTQGCFMPGLVEIDPMVLDKKIFRFRQWILLFRNYLPLEKGVALYITNFNSLHPRMLCAEFGLNWPSGSWEEDENAKSLQQQRRTTDKLFLA